MKKNNVMDKITPTGKFILKSISVKEMHPKNTEIEFDKLNIGDFSLLIGDNAQGKTRLFHLFEYISGLFSNNPKIISTQFNTVIEFEAIKGNKKDKIIYILNVFPKDGKNTFEEEININEKTIFSTKNKILYNEHTKRIIKTFYIPNNIPAVMSITELDFVTINTIREFLQKIIYISSNKTRVIRFDLKSIVPDSDGRNISSVLYNWQKNFPEVYNDVMNELKRCFNYIKNIEIIEGQIPIGGKGHLLRFKEKDVRNPIIQMNWSDGIYRFLHLIMTPKIPYVSKWLHTPPSLILIDEIENGLDFKTLKYIINYLEDYSDESQVIISSHSPLVCDFVNPKNWIVVKRKGSTLKFTSPLLAETDLNEKVEMFKQNYWDFYTKHISNSPLYLVEGNE